MSDSVRPHRRQPTRLPCPWDSPGQNTGVGCHFLLQCMKEKSESEVVQSCPTLRNPMDCSLPGSSIHGIFQARVLEWGAIAFSETMYTFVKTSCCIFISQVYLNKSWGGRRKCTLKRKKRKIVILAMYMPYSLKWRIITSEICANHKNTFKY